MGYLQLYSTHDCILTPPPLALESNVVQLGDYVLASMTSSVEFISDLQFDCVDVTSMSGTLVDMFDRVVLMNSVNNNKAMVCTPGILWQNKYVMDYNTRMSEKILIYR